MITMCLYKLQNPAPWISIPFKNDKLNIEHFNIGLVCHLKYHFQILGDAGFSYIDGQAQRRQSGAASLDQDI